MNRARLLAALLGIAAAAALIVGPAVPPARAAAPPAEGGICGVPVVGMVCDAHTLAYAQPGAGLALDALDKVSPGNILEQWAKSMSESVVRLLGFVQSSTQSQITPAFDQTWWREQYAVSFGLSLVLLAFLLIVVAAKVGGRSGSVSGVELLRASGWRLTFVVPMTAAAPGVLYGVQQMSAALARSFADEATQQAGGAIGKLMKVLQDHAGDWGVFGGTVTVIVVMGFVIVLALVLLVELAIAAWGLDIVGLMLPLTMVMAVYPAWRQPLSRVVGVLGGLLLLPTAIYFVFWTVWSATNSLLATNSGNQTVPLLIYLLGGMLLAAGFPLLAGWLMSLAVPQAGDIDPQIRGAVAEAGAAGLSPVTARLAELAAHRGTVQSTGDADNAGGEDSGWYRSAGRRGKVGTPGGADTDAAGSGGGGGGETTSLHGPTRSAEATTSSSGISATNPGPAGGASEGVGAAGAAGSAAAGGVGVAMAAAQKAEQAREHGQQRVSATTGRTDDGTAGGGGVSAGADNPSADDGELTDRG